MVTLKLERLDFERLNAVLGALAMAGSFPKEERDAYAPIALEGMLASMPADEARRLCDETDRQAAAQVEG
jgi:hypothetical protein